MISYADPGVTRRKPVLKLREKKLEQRYQRLHNARKIDFTELVKPSH